MANENKVKFGLRNVHIFPIEDENDTKITYGKVIKLPGAVNLSLSIEGDENTFYADDIPYYSTFSNNGYSGDLEIAKITDEFIVGILGQQKDENGAIIESINGDVKATRNILYKVTASRPSAEHSTIGETKEPQTDTLSIKAIARSNDGRIKAKLYEGQTGYDTFYDNVYEGKITSESTGQ